MPDSDSPFRWGVLSTAPIAASAYAPAIRASGNGELFAVSSRSLEKAEAFAFRHGFQRAYGSHEELLADPEVDGIYNPMPTSLHAEWTRKAIQAGKPVLCEKPFCCSAPEAEDIWRLSEETGVPTMEALMYLRHPLTQKVKELVESGAIGEPRIIEASFHGVGNPESTRFDPKLGGGALNDLGVYCMSFARWIAGQEPSRVQSSGWIGPTGVDETASVSMGFPSGVQASLNFGLRLPFTCWYRVTGTDGRISVNKGGFVCGPGSTYGIQLEKGGETEVIEIQEANHYQRTAEAFVEVARGGEDAVHTLEDTIAVLRIIDGVRSEIFFNLCDGPKVRAKDSPVRTGPHARNVTGWV